MKKFVGPTLVIACALVTQAHAHKLISPGLHETIAKGAIAASPTHEWNRLKQKNGKYQEVWTLDGDQLNKVTFYGGVPVGKPLFKERDKKNQPLPKVSANMLLTDIPALLETTYRTQFQTTQMAIGKQDVAEVDGRQGIRFTYTFVRSDDEVERTGEGFGTIVDEKLYLITFEAPSLYFFERDVEKFRQILKTIAFKR